jgi:hypothetical protein
MAQYRIDSQEYLANGTTIFEVNMLADKDGNIINTFGAASNIPIAAGTVEGYSSIFRQGFNPNCANGVEESIWCGSTAYPWSAWATPGTLSCVSDDGNDDGTLTLYGLDADFEPVTATVTIDGTNAVVTTGVTFARLNDAIYTNSNGVANEGVITVTRGGTTVASITEGMGACRMAQYTVPAGKTAYLMQGNGNIGKGGDGIGKFKYRLEDSSFVTAFIFLMYQNQFDFGFSTPIVLPEKTDIDVTITTSTGGVQVGCAYDMIVVDNA